MKAYFQDVQRAQQDQLAQWPAEFSRHVRQRFRDAKVDQISPFLAPRARKHNVAASHPPRQTDWHVAHDPKSAKPYYFNVSTNEMSWTSTGGRRGGEKGAVRGED